MKYSLKEIIALNPVSYNLKVHLRSSVKGDEPKETLNLNYTGLVPVLINAIKEQKKQIDELKE